MKLRYRIPEISVFRILPTVTENNGNLYLYLDPEDPSKENLVTYTLQDDCAMFYQAMCVLNKRAEDEVCDALSHAFIYMDFSGIYDRAAVGRILTMQEQAEKLFRPEGIWIDLGKGYVQYLAFERSASMSRNCKLSFVRADLYERLRERMMLGMHIGQCQLSKLYAYNGLLFTGGRRVNIPDLLDGNRIVLIDNPKSLIPNVNTITVIDDGSEAPMRVYSRVEETADIEITEFDGEGLISPELSKLFDPIGDIEHRHHSFQIRLPYIKGVVHEVDFRSLFKELGVTKIRDIFGQLHNLSSVDMILTKSMFKGFGWMKDNNLSWSEYLSRCRQYDHGLYISGMDSLEQRSSAELNYQFLVTANITEEEFRPKDLPTGWKKAPPADRQWITKSTEEAYWSYVGDTALQQDYFTSLANNAELSNRDRKKQQAQLVERNPLFLSEPIFQKELQSKAENILTKYENANLFAAGDNRYLSDDLIRLLAQIAKPVSLTAYDKLMKECLQGAVFYAPQPAYTQNDTCILLRNPHIARNEEVIASRLSSPGPLRSKYLSHLHYVVMVDSRSLIPERLGGADFDGDMIKTISDPLLTQCVLRNRKSTQGASDLPLLKIPAAEPLIHDAEDWKARFEVVKSTFSSRVGQISNAALRRSIIAYDENTENAEKERCRKETELLAILTGLEIDSAKSGIKPDLSEYLGQKKQDKSLFLRFRNIVKEDYTGKWYKPTETQKRKKFFESVDWNEVTSNLEKVPYYAKQLEENTLAIESTVASDEELFTFAADSMWKKKLDPELMKRMSELIEAYEEAERRCQAMHMEPQYMARRTDVQRILFSRNQEDIYTVEELYHSLDSVTPQGIREIRQALLDSKWHFTPPEKRMESPIISMLPFACVRYYDLFCDFRCGGYRLLGDIISDFDDMYRAQEIQRNLSAQNSDSKDLAFLMSGMRNMPNRKEELARRFMHLLNPPGRRQTVSLDHAAMCIIALGKRNLAFEVMPSVLLEHAIDTRAKKKKKWRLPWNVKRT